jgi:hypothetical protein
MQALFQQRLNAREAERRVGECFVCACGAVFQDEVVGVRDNSGGGLGHLHDVVSGVFEADAPGRGVGDLDVRRCRLLINLNSLWRGVANLTALKLFNFS